MPRCTVGEFRQFWIMKVVDRFLLVAATSFQYFKRFYLNNSIMDYHPKEILATCVYLASKVEGELKNKSISALDLTFFPFRIQRVDPTVCGQRQRRQEQGPRNHLEQRAPPDARA
jgi:hypothetical protein